MEGGALCDVGECEECGVGGHQHLCVCGGSSVLYMVYKQPFTICRENTSQPLATVGPHYIYRLCNVYTSLHISFQLLACF